MEKDYPDHDPRLNSLEKKLEKVQSENDYLNQSQQKVNQVFNFQRIQELEQKFEDLYIQYRSSKDECNDLKVNISAKEGEVRSLEKARDNFKDQCYDLKVEIKDLKKKLSHVRFNNIMLSG